MRPEADFRHLDLVVDKMPIAEAEVYDLLAPKRPGTVIVEELLCAKRQ